MDIDRSSFAAQLLNVLEAIADAHFVAIDCEFTGVAKGVRPQNGRGKQSLQDRYDESRKAAAKYQIIQIGLTCAEEVVLGEKYELKTYNFNISPILNEEMEVERVFSVQSSAAEFLLRNNFSFDLPFRHGVQYLSRDEETEAMRKATERLDRARYEDIQLTEKDTEALEFMTKVRGEIDDWLRSKAGPRTNVIASRTKASRDVPVDKGDLTAFERRLVHQLVRAEYPQLISVARPNAVGIFHFDKERDALQKQRQKERSVKKIKAHVGFRWIVEALVSGELNEVDIKSALTSDLSGTNVDYDSSMGDDTFRISRVAALLAKRRPVIVGHNVLGDLIFLYQSFVQDLPERVEKFQKLLRDDFPLIVDTKYMATHNCGGINPASSLEQLDEMLISQSKPAIGRLLTL
jgi:poly(A)-specific ribonuclease